MPRSIVSGIPFRERKDEKPQYSDGAPGTKGWYPEQKLIIAEAIYAHTMGAAHASGLTHRLGSLSPGELADLVVLDHDIWQVEPEEILHTRPLGTMIGGHWVYRQNGLV